MSIAHAGVCVCTASVHLPPPRAGIHEYPLAGTS